MSLPNLKRIALFVQKLLGGSQNIEIWSFVQKLLGGPKISKFLSRDLGHAHLGVVLSSVSSRDPSSMSVPNLKQIALFVQKL